MRKHHILSSVHAPKTGAGDYGLCSPWRQYWCMCHWCKIAYTSTTKLVLSHHEGRCIHYHYFYMIVERRTIHLLEAMGFAYIKDNADESSTHVKKIAHNSPVKLVLSHQESKCICYQCFDIIGERKTISFWHNKDQQAELISKRSAKWTPNLTGCHERVFPELFQGFT